jgi:hypothetical protein
MKLTNKAPRKKSPVYSPMGYNGYSSNSKLFGNSSFWMDTDFVSNSKENRKDVIQLAAYKRAISNFVKIVTGKNDLKVKYSSGVHSYTDGNTVVISSALDEKEFDSTVGLALHEGSHCILTDFSILKHPATLCNSVGLDYTWELFGRLKDLINIIEDRRIDKFVYDSSPGYQGYYTAMYNKYFNAKEIDLALINKVKRARTWDDYLFHICNFMNTNRTLDVLPGLREIWNLIDIRNISRLQSTREVVQLAADVYRIIESNIEASPAPEKESQKESQSQEEGDNQSQGGAQGSMNQEENDEMGSMDDNLDLSEGSGSSSESDSDEMDTDNAPALTDRQMKKLKEAIENQKKFLDGNIKKKNVTNKESAQIEAVSDANIELVDVGNNELKSGWHRVQTGKTKCIVVRGLSESILDLDIIRPMVNPYHKPENTQYIDDGIRLGTQLGKKLKTRDENRDLRTTRMDSGRIDKRLIAELGFGNDRVFGQTINYTTTPGLVHISVDASGSMSGDKWNQSMMTAVAVAKAASMVSSLDCIISIRGCTNHAGSTAGPRPLMWVVYDSRKDKLNNNVINMLRKLDCNGSTPEGLCFESIMKDLIKSAAGRDAYFINLSDGEPGFSNNDVSYYGDQAVKHTQTQVMEMRKAGINVLSYFVSRHSIDHISEAFQTMYGKSSAVIDLTSLTQLSKTVNDLFVRK